MDSRNELTGLRLWCPCHNDDSSEIYRLWLWAGVVSRGQLYVWMSCQRSVVWNLHWIEAHRLNMKQIPNKKIHHSSIMATCFFPKYVCNCILLLVDWWNFNLMILPQLSSERKAAAASVFLELQGLLKRLEPFQDGEKITNAIGLHFYKWQPPVVGWWRWWTLV